MKVMLYRGYPQDSFEVIEANALKVERLQGTGLGRIVVRPKNPRLVDVYCPCVYEDAEYAIHKALSEGSEFMPVTGLQDDGHEQSRRIACRLKIPDDLIERFFAGKCDPDAYLKQRNPDDSDIPF